MGLIVVAYCESSVHKISEKKREKREKKGKKYDKGEREGINTRLKGRLNP